MKKGFHLRDIILLALLGIIFGVIYFAAAFVYNGLTLLLTPIGYGPLANDITMGVWCMAGPLAGFMFRLPGASFLGDQWGAANLISGAVQGVGTELGFTLTGYRIYNWLTIILVTISTTIVTFAWDWFRNGYSQFAGQMLLVMIIVRFISIFLFAGVLNKLIINMLTRAHIVRR